MIQTIRNVPIAKFLALLLIIAPIWTAISALLGVIMTAILTISFIFKENHKLQWRQSLLFFSSIFYLVYFSAIELFSTSPDMSYVISSNLPFLIFGFLGLILPPQTIRQISLFISFGLIAIFCVYLSLKISCDIKILSNTMIDDVFHGDCERVRFMSRNALMTGAMIAALVGIVYADIDVKNKSHFFISSFAIAAGLYLIIFGIQSRGATITVLFLMVIGTVWLAFRFSRKMGILHVGVSIVLLVMLSLLPHLNDQTSGAFSRLNVATKMVVAEPDVSDGSVQSRFDMYRAGIYAFQQKPIFGYGYSNRFNAAVEHLPNSFKSRHHHLHNAIINHLVAGGFFGFLVYIGLFSQGVFSLTVNKFAFNKQNFLLLQVYSCFFLIGITTATMGHFVNTTFFGLALLLATITSRQSSE